METLQPHQQRVVDELDQLNDKRLKLVAFIDESPIFKKLDRLEQGRLLSQSAIMTTYADILQQRIAAF